MFMGKLIVIEGLDGSGKSTQLDRLVKKILTTTDIKIKQIKLPDYDSECCAAVKKYLKGDFGKTPEDVNAYAASCFYAVDRFANYKTKWKADYDDGTLIIADRYTTSNAYHQATKLPKEQWNDYFKWLEDFEYNKIKIPKPDAVIYLDMPIEISQKMMSERYKGDESKKDIHEANIDYLFKCREAAKEAAKAMDWFVIDCADGENPRTIESIGEEIDNYVNKFLY
ncbi:MAG: deoxynucleoside kinase [Clostridia bacterium]|nr:deoxynucleoside kinase [Clostridia bacterium]